MAKKVYGICCICGQETELTFEHIPPRAAFNRFNLKLYDVWQYFTNNNTRYKSAQRGAGKYSLCSSCNNLTGEWYGAAYAEFASQGLSYYQNHAKGILKLPYTIYPLRVFKQIVSCFASSNGPVWSQNIPMIKKFLLNPYEKKFPTDIDIRMYMQEKGKSKFNRIVGQMDVFTGERFVGSEWGYPPFSYILVDDKNFTNYRVLNELYPIKSFLKYGYDERATVFLNVPRKPCNPIILDFREDVPDLDTFIQSKKSNKNPL